MNMGILFRITLPNGQTSTYCSSERCGINRVRKLFPGAQTISVIR